MENLYTYKLVERQIASAVARRVGSMVSEQQRDDIVKAYDALRDAQGSLRNITENIVSQLLHDLRY